jgi:hypothetical protein
MRCVVLSTMSMTSLSMVSISACETESEAGVLAVLFVVELARSDAAAASSYVGGVSMSLEASVKSCVVLSES